MSQEVRREGLGQQSAFHPHDGVQLVQKPRVDAGHLRQLVGSGSPPQRSQDRPEALVRRDADVVARIDVPPRGIFPEQRAAAELEGAHGFTEGRLEAAIDRHHLPRCLHLRASAALAEWELVERPARDLDDDVVERRLEGRRCLSGHAIRDLVERFADRDLCGNPRDGVAGGLGGERRAARHARVYLDDVVRWTAAGIGLPLGDLMARRERELDIAPALDA